MRRRLEESEPLVFVWIGIGVVACMMMCAASIALYRRRARQNRLTYEQSSMIAFERINSAFAISITDDAIDDESAPEPLVIPPGKNPINDDDRHPAQ